MEIESHANLLEVKNEEKLFCVPNAPIVVTKSQPVKISKPVPEATLDYEEPKWSSKPSDDENYYLEVIKNGTQMENIELKDKNFFSFGRYNKCDIVLEHPSLSRFHLILQYSKGDIDSSYPKGFYLYDLNSTHGTIVNKKRIEARKYVKLNEGSVIKIGGSTRLYIYHAPEETTSEDLNINVTHEQMKKIKEKYDRISNKIKIQKGMEEIEAAEKEDSDENGIDWGMGNLDDEEEEGKISADALQLMANQSYNDRDESYYSSDPRKALKVFFDREGEELFYEFEELGYGSFKCRVRLPVDNSLGEPIYAEFQGSGKKKEIQAQCALEACRILDAHGILKESKEILRKKRKEKDWENADYYDSDEDIFLDRTGDIEKKRQKRMKQLGKNVDDNQIDLQTKNKVHTFESLKEDYQKLFDEQIDITKKLDKCKNIEKAVESDDLDAYINSLKQGDSMDHFTRSKLKRRLTDLNQEMIKCHKLLSVAKPSNFDLDEWKNSLKTDSEIKSIQKPKKITKPLVLLQPPPIPQITEELEEAIPTVKSIETKQSTVKAHQKKIEKQQIEPEKEPEPDYKDLSRFKEYSTWLPPESKF